MILVTGATGFVGRHVVDALKKAGLPVRLLLLEGEKHLAKDFPGAEIVLGNLTNFEALDEAVAGVETIIHLASKNIDHGGTGFQKINVDGTRALCEKGSKAGVQKFIYLSTVGVYGHGKHSNADETMPVKADTDFSRSKAEAESIVLEHHRSDQMQGIILRHRFVYGKGDQHVIPRMIKAAVNYPFMIGGGKAKISFILADDLANIVLQFVQSATSIGENPIYHVTDGNPIAYRDVIEIICKQYELLPPEHNLPFGLIYVPVWLKEKIFNIDPETTKSSISTMRLKLVGLDNSFSNAKLMQHFPDLKLTTFEKGFLSLTDYYAQFLTKAK